MNKLYKNIALATISLLLVSCADNENGYGIPDLNGDCTSLIPTITINELANNATSINTIYDITTNEIIEGYVVSSDEGGNFYKTVSIVSTDNTKGMSISLDATGTFSRFEPGRKVFIKLNGLNYERATSFTNGINIGVMYQASNGPRIGRIDNFAIDNYLQRACDKVNEDILVKNLTIAQVKNDQYLNQLIEIEGVQFTASSLGYNYFDEALKSYNDATAIDHKIIDQQANELIVRVSEFANFASNPVSQGNGKIRGVLTKYNSTYQFMIRSLTDIKFNNERFNIKVENFENYTNNTNTFADYENIKVIGTNDWYVGSFNNNKYLQVRKAASTGNTVAYFIMPFDFSTYTKLSFESLFGYMSRYTNPTQNPNGYNKPLLKVYYSTNYNVQDPTANLIDITNEFTYSSFTGSGWAPEFVNSGTYTFNGVTGQGHIIFAYECNFTSNTTAESRPAIQLDNIKFE